MGEDRAVVLLYHRVAYLSDDPWGLAVSPARFAEHVELLASEYPLLLLSDLVARVGAGDVPGGSVAVSFDDGYRDNLATAAPLLDRHGVPATIFVASSYVGSGVDFWWDELAMLCPADRYRDVHGELQGLGAAERDERLADLRGGRRAAREPQTMSADELRRLAAYETIDIGAHTATHAALSSLGADAQLDELRSSREQLEALLGTPVPGVSYPYGTYAAETPEHAARAGFAYACTSGRRPVSGGTSLFELPRYPIGDWPAEELSARIRSWLAG